MKNGEKRFLGILIIILIISLIGGCGKKVEKDSLGDVDKDPNKNDHAESLNEKETIIREEEDKLVKVAIEDGTASIFFDFHRWEELHELKETAFDFIDTDAMEEGPFVIETESGKVADAIIGKIQSITYSEYNFVIPTIVLLMEDGSLEWLYADPYMTEDLKELGGEYENYVNFRSFGKLSYKDDFVSLSYESDNEGFGSYTIFLENKKSDKFDFRNILFHDRLVHGTWTCPLPPTGQICGYLSFNENGEVHWEIGMGNDYETSPFEAFEVWDGTYEYIMTEAGGYPLGTLVFDMGGWWIYEGSDDDADLGYSTKIEGSYRTEFQSDGSMTLYYNDGVMLYQFKDDMEYTFHNYENWDEE